MQTVGKFSRAGILEMEFIGGSSEKGKGVVESDCALGGFDGLLLNQASAPLIGNLGKVPRNIPFVARFISA